MAYSTYQMRRIREALRHFKRFGGPIGGKGLSWPAVAGAIELYTSLEISTDKENASLENIAEKLRQFVDGSVRSRGNKPRNIDPSLIRHIVEFLAHDEIGLLNLDEAFPHDIDPLMDGSVYSYLHNGKDDQHRRYRKNETGCFAGARFTPTRYLEPLYPWSGIYRRYSLCHIYYETHPLAGDTFAAHLTLSIPVPSLSSRKERRVVKRILHGSGIYNSSNSAIVFLRSTMFDDSMAMSCHFTHTGLLMEDIHPSSTEGAVYHGRLPIFDENVRNNLVESPAINELLNKKQDCISQLDMVDTKYEDTLYNSNLQVIIDAFDPEMAWYSVQHQMDHYQIIGSNVEPQDPIRISSERLIYLLRKGSFAEVADVVEQGARFDHVDEDTGYTALHILAHLGWRDGIMLALSHPDRCNLLIEDRDRHRASYHAAVYGGDEALARLLRVQEDRHALRPAPGMTPH